MRIAALGDIHGNYAALKAALHRIESENARVTLFMGDYVSDCAEPRETLDLIAQYAKTHDCRFVRGNREQYMLDYHGDGSWRRGTAGGSLLYTYERLTEDDLAFFESMPRVRVERFGDCPPLLMCHGSPENLRGVPAREPDRARKWLEEAGAGVLICAHSHRPAVMPLGGGRTLVNTGSAGVSVTRPSHAQLALLDGENGRWTARLIEEPYDAEEAIRAFYEKGFFEEAGLWADMMARQLREGGEWAVDMVRAAMKLAREAGITSGLVGDIPESLWRQAAQSLAGCNANDQ